MKKVILTFLAMILFSVSSYAYTIESFTDILTKTIVGTKAALFADYKILHTAINTLQKGNIYSYTTELDANVEYKIIGIGGDGIKDLDIEVLDANGVSIIKDIKSDNVPEVSFKLYLAQRCTIKIKAYSTETGKENDDNLFMFFISKK